jgi:hypothetical protein
MIYHCPPHTSHAHKKNFTQLHTIFKPKKGKKRKREKRENTFGNTFSKGCCVRP